MHAANLIDNFWNQKVGLLSSIELSLKIVFQPFDAKVNRAKAQIERVVIVRFHGFAFGEVVFSEASQILLHIWSFPVINSTKPVHLVREKDRVSVFVFGHYF